MLADAVLLSGSIIGCAIGIGAGIKLGFALATPSSKSPAFAQRFRKLWYCEETRRIYGEVWQRGVWYEVSYSGVRTSTVYEPDSNGLHRFDGGPAWHIGDFAYAVLHALWWQQNSGDTESVRRFIHLLLTPERTRP